MLRWMIAIVFLIMPAVAQPALAQEKRLDSLIVSYSSVTGNRAPFWIAKDLGLYEKYGLDVKLVNIAAGSVSLTALLAGNVHLTTDSSSGVVAAAARGAPIVTVSTNGALPYQFVALASIKSPDDLKGKIVGSSRIGAGTDFLLRRILAKIGLTPGKDVSLIPTGVSESDKRLQLIFQGKIDATIGESDKVFQVTEERRAKTHDPGRTQRLWRGRAGQRNQHHPAGAQRVAAALEGVLHGL